MKKFSLMGLLIGVMCFFGIGGVSAEEISPIPGGGATGDLSGGESGEVIKENTYFKDEKFKEFVFNAFKEENPSTTKTKAEQLTDTELASIKSLIAETELGENHTPIFLQIKDLSGIEKLTGLEDIALSIIGINKIDFSNNIKISHLVINNQGSGMVNIEGLNPQIVESLSLTKAKISDLAKFENLVYLLISESDESTYDFSRMSNLEHLTLSDNEISNINLTNNQKLTHLYLENTSLTQLDISKNTKLEALEIYGTDIKCLDISKNKSLTHLMTSYNDENALNGGDTNGVKLIKDSDTGNACAQKVVNPTKTKANETIKNPKTGFGLPVAGLGILVVTLGTAVVIRKKGLFRNI